MDLLALLWSWIYRHTYYTRRVYHIGLFKFFTSASVIHYTKIYNSVQLLYHQFAVDMLWIIIMDVYTFFGRLMSPRFGVSISGLEPMLQYTMKLEVVLADKFHFQYINERSVSP